MPLNESSHTKSQTCPKLFPRKLGLLLQMCVHWLRCLLFDHFVQVIFNYLSLGRPSGRGRLGTPVHKGLTLIGLVQLGLRALVQVALPVFLVFEWPDGNLLMMSTLHGIMIAHPTPLDLGGVVRTCRRELGGGAWEFWSQVEDKKKASGHLDEHVQQWLKKYLYLGHVFSRNRFLPEKRNDVPPGGTRLNKKGRTIWDFFLGSYLFVAKT